MNAIGRALATSFLLFSAACACQPRLAAVPNDPVRELAVGEEVRVAIEAGRVWNPTPVVVDPAQQYSLRVYGTQQWTDGPYESDANGYRGWFNFLVKSKKRVPAEKFFALIGAIDKDESTAEKIGIHRENWSPPRRGQLFAYANDLPTRYCNNLGSLDLTIRRTK